MIRSKNILGILLLLVTLSTWCCAAWDDKAGSPEATLAYSLKASPYPSVVLVRSPSGTPYRLSLIPQLDVEHHVVVLELVLQEGERKADDLNLLDVTGTLHGYQPYFFAASDFAEGARNSIYGESRVIDLSRLGMAIHITVVKVNVTPTGASSSKSLRYQFDDLILRVATESLGGGASK